jgi:hypothetical protein
LRREEIKKQASRHDAELAEPRIAVEDEQVDIAGDQVVGIATEGSGEDRYVVNVPNNQRNFLRLDRFRTRLNEIKEVCHVVRENVMASDLRPVQDVVQLLVLFALVEQTKLPSAPTREHRMRIATLEDRSTHEDIGVNDGSKHPLPHVLALGVPGALAAPPQPRRSLRRIPYRGLGSLR